MRASDRFVREEVQRQGFNLDTPNGITRFHWMQSAWAWAKNKADVAYRPSVRDILSLGCAVEPLENPQGFRKVPVMVRGNRAVGWEDVPNALRKLWKYGKDLTAEQFYYEFEMIHPFTDGNGRVGAILYNWLRGTWRKPEAPPDVFLGHESGWRRMLRDATLPQYKEDWPEMAKQVINYPIQGADEVGYIVEPDIGKHDCDEPDCHSCHNCGITGVDIDSKWNLCDVCDNEYTGGERVDWDEEAEEYEAQLDAEEELESCCAPWWEPCCTKDGEPL